MSEENNGTFTKEELTELVNNAVTKATEGMYSEEEFQKKLQAEVDRRVQTGIDKGVKTQLDKWKEEQELTAEELAKKKIEEQKSELESFQNTLLQKENRLNAINKLTESGIGREDYDGMLDFLVDADSETTETRVGTFIEKFQGTKTRLEKKLKEKYTSVPAPDSNSGDEAITKDKFNNMSYQEKVALKQEQPDVYKTMIE